MPNGWEMNRMISLGHFSKGKNITKSDLSFKGFPCILYSHIYTEFDRIFTVVNSYINENKFSNSTKILKGQFLFTSSGETVEDIGKCVLYDGEETISIGGDIIVFTLFEPINFDKKFLSYVFNADFFNNQKSSNSNGEIVVHIYEKQLREIKFTYPILTEQKLISQYLDKETQKIDSLIVKYEKKIELLKEQKMILINQYVTRGIDPNIEIKNTGLEWVGEISKQWNFAKLRWYIDDIKDGTHGSHPSLDEGKLLLSGKNVIDGFLKIQNNERRIPNESHLEITKNGFPKKGDVLVSCVGSIGRSCVYELEDTISFQRSVCFIRPSEKIDSYYLSYLIRSKTCQEQLITLTNQSTVGGVYMNDILDLVITIPPIKEQKEIVKMLDIKVSKIDLSVFKHGKKIELLNEYRLSLISSLVTGKIRIKEDII